MSGRIGIEDAALSGDLVIFAGAGISSGAPTSLPAWKPLNVAIFRALRERIETGLERHGWLADIEARVEAAREADRFPPDYQAQVMEEMCGERYFRALQALDIDVVNGGHEEIAALAASGAVRGIVTTNFDRLIERELERRGSAFETVFDREGFLRMRDRFAAGVNGPLPVIKIHGCVSEALSMIDTLKQRRRGRSTAIEECLEGLSSGYWVYVGFSAADLETDLDYLGLMKMAPRSGGSTYVAHPSCSNLRAGAKALMGAYGEAGEIVVAEAGEYLAAIYTREERRRLDGSHESGKKQFEKRLKEWADGLTLSATGLCLAAMAEAVGEANHAAHILDRLVRKEIPQKERDSPDFHHLQLHYGRLGVALGRYVNVPDLNGTPSNASVEAPQSLYRLVHQGHADADYAFGALAQMTCLHLWLGDGKDAMDKAGWTIRGFLDNEWGGIGPRNDEDAVDAWLTAAQVCLINRHARTLNAIMATFEDALARARHSGDVVRTARVIGIYLLAHAEIGMEDTRAMAIKYEVETKDAERVGDGFALGFVSLALGRWHTGRGGVMLAREMNDRSPVARVALQHLSVAADYFGKQSMDPWAIYTAIQQIKAFADLREIVAANDCKDQVIPWVNRFLVLQSHLHEAIGQIQLMIGDGDAPKNFRKAIKMAEEDGLLLWKDYLTECYGEREGVMGN